MEDKARLLRKRINFVFFILCSVPMIRLISSFFSVFFRKAVTPSLSFDSDFIWEYFLPQAIYFVISLAVFGIIPYTSGCRVSSIVRTNDVPAAFFIFPIPIFISINLIYSRFTDFLSSIGITSTAPQTVSSAIEGPLQIILFLIVSCFLPAICEEIIFRGIICGMFRGLNNKFAVLLSSLAFSLVHASFSQNIISFILGFILSIIYILSDSVLPCIVLHFINNLISSIFILLEQMLSEAVYDKIFAVFEIVFYILSIVTVLITVFFVTRKHCCLDIPTHSVINDREAAQATLSSAGLWIFCIALTWEMLFLATVI